MRFLITGASGFLGKVIVRNLLKSNYDIITLGRRGQDIKYDITTSSINLEANLNIDCVVHVAGKAHVTPKNREEENEFYKVNLEGTKNLCKSLTSLKQPPRSIIYISSVSVYGEDVGCNIDESYPLLGSTPYAKSKIMAEQWLAEWALREQVTLGVLRLPLIVGPNPPGNLGAMIRGIKSGRYFSIGKADVRKSMVLAEDVAEVIPRLSEIGGIYNLTDGYHPTFGELEFAISNSLNKKKPIKMPLWVASCFGWSGDVIGDKFPIDSKKLRKITSTLTFDDTRAREKLAWNPSKVLDAISEIII